MSNIYSQHLRSRSPNYTVTPPHSPLINQDQNFDEALKSSRFFKKPDIVPYPYANFDMPSMEQSSIKEGKSEDLAKKLEYETKLRLIAEDDNLKLRSKITELQEYEKLSREHSARNINNKNADFLIEIENLRVRVRILTEENELLRARLNEKSDASLNSKPEGLEKIDYKNRELLRELTEFKDAYEELRKIYAQDISSQKARYEKLYNEKKGLEGRLRDLLARHDDLVEAEPMQEKIRKMKNEYRDKVKELEKRIQPEDKDEVSDARLKEIEARLTVLQGKLTEQSAYNEKALMRRAPQKSSKAASPRRENSPYATWRTMNVSPNFQDSEKNTAYSNKSPRNTERGFKDTLNSSRGRSKRDNGSKSPTRGSSNSPGGRSSSRHRHSPQHKQCETCIRKHGHDWARRNN